MENMQYDIRDRIDELEKKCQAYRDSYRATLVLTNMFRLMDEKEFAEQLEFKFDSLENQFVANENELEKLLKIVRRN